MSSVSGIMHAQRSKLYTEHVHSVLIWRFVWMPLYSVHRSTLNAHASRKHYSSSEDTLHLWTSCTKGAPPTNNTALTLTDYKLINYVLCVCVCVCTCSLGAWKSSLQAKSFPVKIRLINQSVNHAIDYVKHEYLRKSTKRSDTVVLAVLD